MPGQLEAKLSRQESFLESAAQGDVERMQSLMIEKTVDINLESDFRRNECSMMARGTALIQALNHGKNRTAAILLKAGADHNKTLHTPSPSPECFRYEDECTSLVLATINAHIGVMTMLINRGADINAGGPYGYTPLMAAAAHGHHNIVKILLKQNADVNAVTNLGATALTMAAKEGHADIVDTLLAAGADICVELSPNKIGSLYQQRLKPERTLSLAANLNHKEIVSSIVIHGAASQNSYFLEWQKIQSEIDEIYKDRDACKKRKAEYIPFAFSEVGLGNGEDEFLYSHAMREEFINYRADYTKELFTKEAVIFLAKILPDDDLRNRIIDDFNNETSKTRLNNKPVLRSFVPDADSANTPLNNEDMQQIALGRIAILRLEDELMTMSLLTVGRLPYVDQYLPEEDCTPELENKITHEEWKILSEEGSPESGYLSNVVLCKLRGALTKIANTSPEETAPSLKALSAKKILTEDCLLESIVEAVTNELKKSYEIQEKDKTTSPTLAPSSFRKRCLPSQDPSEVERSKGRF